MTKLSKYLKICNILGNVIAILAALMLIPVLVAAIYGEWDGALEFFYSALICFGTGVVLVAATWKFKNISVEKQYAAVAVVFSWIVAALFGCIPFLFWNELTFSQSMFETISGWTTTGLSVVDVASAPHCILMWRSLTQFVGGMGLVFVTLVILPNGQAAMLYNAEGHSDKISPNLRKTLFAILGVYVGYTVLGIILYVAVGMPVFDAINHSMTALATAGFSTVPGSIGYYNNIGIEIVSIFLMLAGAVNFAVHLLVFSGKFRRAGKVLEVRALPIILILFLPILIFAGLAPVYGNVGQQFRVGIFEGISAITTTGFDIQSPAGWAFALPKAVLILFMLVGGQSGSTAGGIKVGRVALMFKSIWWSIKKTFLPASHVQERYIYTPAGKKFIEQEDILFNNNFVLLYLIFWLAGGLFISAFGFTFEQGLFEFSSCMATVGISSGVTSATMPVPVLWALCVGMFFGRLELIIVFVAFSKVIKDVFVRS